MSEIRVAVLGARGWMGRIHTMAYQNIASFYGTSHGKATVAMLVTSDPDAVDDLRAQAPQARIVPHWQQAIDDPDIDLIDICLPDSLHYPVAKAAILAGKHVFCEKPLADTAAQARELADLAQARGVITRVGHAFPRNPVHDRAKELIEAGEIGEITLFKGWQHIDVFGDPDAPFMWRADGALAATGIIGDTGSHVFSFMDYLVGPVKRLMADAYIATPKRKRADGTWADVTNPDGCNLLCDFANGARGVVDFSRIATGQKFRQGYEIYGTKGSLIFDYDQTNRLRFYSNQAPEGQRGFTAIDIGPENPNFRAFLPLANLSLGYNESKIIEAAEVIRSIRDNKPMWPTFETGHHICQIVDACMQSSAERRWVAIG